MTIQDLQQNQQTVNSQTPGSQTGLNAFGSLLYLGGHPNDVQQLTGSYFDQGRVGCIRQFATAINPGSQTLPSVNLQTDPMGGAGITTCS